MNWELLLTVSRVEVEAEVRHRGRPVWRGSAEHGGPDDLGAAIAQLATAGAPLHHGPVVKVEFVPPIAQVRTLDRLPPVRGRALADLVSVQRSRYFRQNGKPLVTAARWLSRKRGQPPIARAAAIEQHWGEAVLDACRTAGLDVDTMGPAGLGEAQLDLMPPAERLARGRRLRARLRRWSLAAAAGWVLLGVAAAVRFSHEERRVTARLDALKKPAAALASAKAALRDGSETLATVAAAEGKRAGVLRVMAAVVEALPDSSYLTVFELDAAGTGSMGGFAWRSGEVAEHLDARQAIVAPRLIGAQAGTILGAGEWQPFTLEFGGLK
jgi:hypothetical protein